MNTANGAISEEHLMKIKDLLSSRKDFYLGVEMLRHLIEDPIIVGTLVTQGYVRYYGRMQFLDEEVSVLSYTYGSQTNLTYRHSPSFRWEYHVEFVTDGKVEIPTLYYGYMEGDKTVWFNNPMENYEHNQNCG